MSGRKPSAKDQTMSDPTARSVLSQLSNDLAAAVDAAAASVVIVDARRRFPASGVVWNDQGVIATASHVVERDDDLAVILPDGRRVEATLIGRDPGTDVALLKIDPAGATPAKKTAIDTKPGHLVLAIGRVDDSGPQASFGAVSAIGGFFNRPGRGSQSFIRAEIAMLPGFSGGPLIDATGAVIGINTSHLGRGHITIPAAVVDWVAAGKSKRGFIGVGVQAVTIPQALAAAAGVTQEQALVIVGIEPGGPAETAGFYIGDVILGINDQPVSSVEEFQAQLSGDLVGTQAAIKVIRGGAVQTIQTNVVERAEPKDRPERGERGPGDERGRRGGPRRSR
jgi:S1-C subfamily serine protease